MYCRISVLTIVEVSTYLGLIQFHLYFLRELKHGIFFLSDYSFLSNCKHSLYIILNCYEILCIIYTNFSSFFLVYNFLNNNFLGYNFLKNWIIPLLIKRYEVFFFYNNIKK